MWKIFVGRTKLSRGFTVEGLTTTYYTRRTQAADTLMQMGRWFGYRAGYKDLVRLSSSAGTIPGPRDTRVDLYKAFEAVVQDGEDFRAELRSYQGLGGDGRPRVRPIDVPPMVFQSLPGMKPTGTNKMYNRALLQGRRGKVKDSSSSLHAGHRSTAATSRQPSRCSRRQHFGAISSRKHLASIGRDTGSCRRTAPAWSSRRFTWNEKFDSDPRRRFMDRAAAEESLAEWAFSLLLAGSSVAPLKIRDLGDTLPILERTRRDDKDSMFSGGARPDGAWPWRSSPEVLTRPHRKPRKRYARPTPTIPMPGRLRAPRRSDTC